MVFEGLDGLDLYGLVQRSVAVTFEHNNEPMASIIDSEFLDNLYDY